jgi:hypothetical protein
MSIGKELDDKPLVKQDSTCSIGAFFDKLLFFAPLKFIK